MNAPINPPNETVEDGHLQLMAGDALGALERSQIDMQITTAKKYPRSMRSFLDEATSMISLSPEIAEGCNYKLKRKNSDGGMTYIEGPSVRLLEIAASAYGNLRYGSRTIGIDDEFVTAQGVAHDLERNNYCTVEVKRSIKGKRGRYSNDMIMVTANAAGSIARRNALNGGIIPRVYINALSEHAKKVALGDIKTLPERRQRAFGYFTGTLGIPLERVLAYLERKSIEDCNLADVSDLQDLKTALKEGQSTVEEVFSDKAGQQAATQKPPLDATPATPAAATPPPAAQTLPPQPNEGPSKKGKAKVEPAPAVPSPAPEPTPAPQAQAKVEKPAEQEPPTPPEDGDLGPQPADSPTPQQALGMFLDDNGVSFGDFKDWLEFSGRLRDATKLSSIQEVPAVVCNLLHSDGGKALARCVKQFGKAV
jgi:hypothetical protein